MKIMVAVGDGVSVGVKLGTKVAVGVSLGGGSTKARQLRRRSFGWYPEQQLDLVQPVMEIRAARRPAPRIALRSGVRVFL
jgi:hypothetical protein